MEASRQATGCRGNPAPLGAKEREADARGHHHSVFLFSRHCFVANEGLPPLPPDASLRTSSRTPPLSAALASARRAQSLPHRLFVAWTPFRVVSASQADRGSQLSSFFLSLGLAPPSCGPAGGCCSSSVSQLCLSLSLRLPSLSSGRRPLGNRDWEVHHWFSSLPGTRTPSFTVHLRPRGPPGFPVAPAGSRPACWFPLPPVGHAASGHGFLFIHPCSRLLTSFVCSGLRPHTQEGLGGFIHWLADQAVFSEPAFPFPD